MDQFKINLVTTVLEDWKREVRADGWDYDTTCWPWLAYELAEGLAIDEAEIDRALATTEGES